MGRLERRIERFLAKLIWGAITLPFVLLYHLIRWAYFSKDLNADGYALVKTETGKEKFEHRVVAEEILGRKLKHWEVVHHINGKRNDNRPVNLCVMSHENHVRYHEWYDWVRTNYKVYPKRQTSLRKLREDFYGIILTEYSRKKDQAG